MFGEEDGQVEALGGNIGGGEGKVRLKMMWAGGMGEGEMEGRREEREGESKRETDRERQKR